MKLRAVHLLSEPNSKREKRSINKVSQIKDYGIEYLPIINPPYEGDFPEPRECSDRPFSLTSRHYGCYQAHKNAIFDQLNPDIDALLVFECDAVFCLPIEQMVERFFDAARIVKDNAITVFTFGYRHDGKTIEKFGNVILITQFIETHAYLIPYQSRKIFEEIFALPWDTIDYVYTLYLYDQRKLRIGTFSDRPIAVQATGMSLLDQRIKTSENHFRAIRYA